MCFAFPGKIVKISGAQATIDYGTEKRKAHLVEGEKFGVGDYVIVQGKMVLEKVNKEDAEKWLEMVTGGRGTR